MKTKMNIKSKFRFDPAKNPAVEDSDYILKANSNYGVQVSQHAGLNGIETYYTPWFWDDEIEAMDFADETTNLDYALKSAAYAWLDAMETADKKMGE